MPTTQRPAAPVSRPAIPPVKPVNQTADTSYVKFSDKLTDSLEDITRMINEHKAMIDAIQEVGIQLTGAIGTLHTLTVKYAGVVNNVLDILLPLMKNIPIIPPKLVELATKMEKLTQNIIDTSAATSKTITDVNAGLKTGDVNRLKAHSQDLQGLTKTLTDILPKVD